MELKTETEHLCFKKDGEIWRCHEKAFEIVLAEITFDDNGKRYTVKFNALCNFSLDRIKEIAEFVGQLNGQSNPTSAIDTEAESGEAKQITEALALTDATV